VNDVSEFDFSQFDCCNWAWWVGEVATNWLLRGCISYFRQPKKKGNAVCLKEEDLLAGLRNKYQNFVLFCDFLPSFL